ncbi:hypothetical protein EXS74_03490 [Candidatus Woesearchaeota archaeon]|nr:hypothetical protein [Candidatus Woesearchaeota archaeon]
MNSNSSFFMDRLYFDSSISCYVTSDRESFVALRDTTFLGEGRPTIYLNEYNDQDELFAGVEGLVRALPKGIKPDAFSCSEVIPGRMYAVDFLRVRKESYSSLLAQQAAK